MFEKLETVEQRYNEIDTLLSDPDVFKDRQRYHQLTSERAQIAPIVEAYLRYKTNSRRIEDNRALLNDHDSELVKLAEEENAQLHKDQEELETLLQVMLLPNDPRDAKNVILEIRAGTGGEAVSYTHLTLPTN